MTESWNNEDFLSFDSTVIQAAPENSDGNDSYDSMHSFDSKEESESVYPPWIESATRKFDSRQIHPLSALHNEIVSFCHLMEPLPSEITQRENLVTRVRKTVERHFKEGTKVEVFGSQATGLFLPTSDIDIVVITENEDIKLRVDEDTCQNADESESNGDVEYNHRESLTPLQRFAAAIQEDWLDELSYFEVIEKTRVPLVKFRHAPTNIQVDVCFNQETGPPAAQLMKKYLNCFPPLRPLTIVLKYFLAARGLNEPYSGGVGSYMLQLLIVAFLQHRERDAVNFKRPSLPNLGSLLLEFFELYGCEFNYLITGISARNDGFYFPKGASDRKQVFWQQLRPLMVALENPLDITHDVGSSSFRFQTVQRSFATAYKILLCYVVSPAIELSPSILSTILPPTDYMSSRLILRRRDHALLAPRKSDDTGRKNKRQKESK